MYLKMLYCIFAIVLTSSFGFDTSSIDAAALKENISRRKTGSAGEGAIDNSIDESTYYIGGGDKFTISHKDMPLITYYGAVNSNGDLFIPNLGVIELGKITLREAKQLIAERLQKRLNKEVYVSLSEVKNATITITGSVKTPGTYVHSGTFRLLDAISIANQDSLPPIEEMNYRSIKCVNSGNTAHYDLYKYLLRGDLSQNPYIYPGDEIIIEPASENVYLTGEVISKNQWIPIHPGEDLKDFLSLFNLSASADTDKIIVKRSGQKTSETEIITVNLEQYTPVELQDEDMIVVSRKENYPAVLQISVTGEAVRPGQYPIRKKAMTALELIKQAGGATQHGDLSRAVILRHGKSFPKNLTTTEVRPEINSAFSMSNLKKDFTVIRIKKKDIYLEHGDQIFIPSKDDFVYVSGSVKDPGGISYKEGKNLSYYLRQAGGFQRNADRHNVVVVSNYAGAMVTKSLDNIEQGDIIIVPVSRQNRFLSSVFLPLLQAAATTISVILAIYSTANN